MAFIRENDDLRREAPHGHPTTFRYWPKVDGANVLVETDSASAELYDPSGAALGALEVTESTVEVDPGEEDTAEVSRLDLSIPAGLALAEDYQVQLTYQVDSEPLRDAFTFDVVLYPLRSACTLSLNDLAEVRPDVIEVLDRQGRRLGYADAGQTMAAIYSTRALIEIDGRLRDLIAQARDTRPALLVNRERLLRPLRYTALRMVFEAESSNPTEDGTDEASGLARHYRAEAESAWRGVGPLKFRHPAASAPTPATPGPDVRVRPLRRSW